MVCFYLIVLPRKAAFSENHQISLEISGYTFEYSVKANETLGTYIEIPRLRSSCFTAQLDSNEWHTAPLCDLISFSNCVVKLFDAKDTAGIERFGSWFAYASADW